LSSISNQPQPTAFCGAGAVIGVTVPTVAGDVTMTGPVPVVEVAGFTVVGAEVTTGTTFTVVVEIASFVVVGVASFVVVVVTRELRPHPFAAPALLEATPMPSALRAKTAAVKRAARFGPHDVPFFDAFIWFLLCCLNFWRGGLGCLASGSPSPRCRMPTESVHHKRSKVNTTESGFYLNESDDLLLCLPRSVLSHRSRR
jgi:hypothetical protein